MQTRPSYPFLFAVALCAALLSACASSVNLNESQVSDAKGVPVQAEPVSGQPVGKPADVSQADAAVVAAAQGPVNVARLVYFDYDSFVVKPEFQAVLEGHARHLMRFKSVRVVIEGHTDERGGREYNLALGQKRADAVRKSLALLGVPERQMESVSYGKEKPADAGGTEQAWAKNRRAQINYH